MNHILQIESAPKTGTRILLQYEIYDYPHTYIGTKWEECLWRDDHWEPWGGCANRRSTDCITHAVGWLPHPEQEG